MKLLLSHNASADFANPKGTNALMRASQEGHIDISKLLLSSNASVNRKNNEGMNALMLASQRGHAEMVSLLINAGATIDEQTSQGSTALTLACKRGNFQVVEVLVSMGAEIFITDSRGRTARDTAIRRQHNFLLPLLDTQYQMTKIAENRRKIRTAVLSEFSQQFQKGKLQIHPTIQSSINHLLNIHKNIDSTVKSVPSINNYFYNANILKPRSDIFDWQWPLVLMK